MKDKIERVLHLHMEGGADKNGDYTNVIPEVCFESVTDDIHIAVIGSTSLAKAYVEGIPEKALEVAKLYYKDDAGFRKVKASERVPEKMDRFNQQSKTVYAFSNSQGMLLLQYNHQYNEWRDEYGHSRNTIEYWLEEI